VGVVRKKRNRPSSVFTHIARNHQRFWFSARFSLHDHMRVLHLHGWLHSFHCTLLSLENKRRNSRLTNKCCLAREHISPPSGTSPAANSQTTAQDLPGPCSPFESLGTPCNTNIHTNALRGISMYYLKGKCCHLVQKEN
jgi:hypothetical protein